MNTNAVFPYPEWMDAVKEKINSDEKYTQIARNWEGDLRLVLEVDPSLHEPVWLFFDLWHGKCREAYVEDHNSLSKPVFVINGPYGNYVKILSGQTGVMQALMSRMVGVKGNYAYLMRNIPTIIDFVRCCQEATHSWV
jgi:putative sterol carrier protein